MKIRSKTGLRVFGMAELRSWGPCYDPTRHLPETFRGTALDILTNDKIPLQDRLWVVLRTALLSEETLWLFAVWAARQVQHLNSDPRIETCLQTVEAFIAGTATLEQMRQARQGAWGCRYAATYAAAADAAYATYAAAYADAATTATYAAAARTAEREKQVKKLIEMIKADGVARLEQRKSLKKEVLRNGVQQ
jgi:hypothetical protein